VRRATDGQPAGDGRLSLEQLTAAVDDGAVDTVLLAMTDMQGRLQGKRLHARHFLDDTVGHAAEGCNYLLAVDVDMNTVDGYAMSSWSTGYGDFVFRPDLATLRRVPWQAGHGDGDVRPGMGGREPRRRLAAADPEAPAGAARRARLGRPVRYRARVHRLQGHLRGRLAQGLPRPDARQPVQRRLLAARYGARRAAAQAHPQRDAGCRHAVRVGQGGVQPRAARGRVPVRRGAADRGQPRGLQERRQGDRCRGGLQPHVHEQVRRARRQQLPHPPERPRGGRRAGDGGR
jgi:hypothetical protein